VRLNRFFKIYDLTQTASVSQGHSDLFGAPTYKSVAEFPGSAFAKTILFCKLTASWHEKKCRANLRQQLHFKLFRSTAYQEISPQWHLCAVISWTGGVSSAILLRTSN